MKSKRHFDVLNIVLQELVKYNEIDSVYLYGSCNRDEEKYDSDVDLFITLNIPFDNKYAKLIREIRTIERPYTLPDVDCNFLFSGHTFEEIKNFKDSYYVSVYKEATLLWEKETGFTDSYLKLNKKFCDNA